MPSSVNTSAQRVVELGEKLNKTGLVEYVGEKVARLAHHVVSNGLGAGSIKNEEKFAGVLFEGLMESNRVAATIKTNRDVWAKRMAQMFCKGELDSFLHVLALQDDNRKLVLARVDLPEFVIGKGGMGELYRVSTEGGEEDGVLKLLGEDVMHLQKAHDRMRREEDLLEEMNGDGTPSIHSRGSTMDERITKKRRSEMDSDERPFFTQGRIKGVTLEELQLAAKRRTPPMEGLPPKIVRLLFDKAARALDRLHKKQFEEGEEGIIHRDIKPANIMLSDTGEIILIDLGLARKWKTEETDLTTTADFIGTAAYMAPEQAEPELDSDGKPIPVDKTTDIYQLSSTMYKLLVGETPISGEDRMTRRRAKQDQTFDVRTKIRPLYSQYDQRLAHLLEWGMQQSMAARPDSVPQLLKGGALDCDDDVQGLQEVAGALNDKWNEVLEQMPPAPTNGKAGSNNLQYSRWGSTRKDAADSYLDALLKVYDDGDDLRGVPPYAEKEAQIASLRRQQKMTLFAVVTLLSAGAFAAWYFWPKKEQPLPPNGGPDGNGNGGGPKTKELVEKGPMPKDYDPKLDRFVDFDNHLADRTTGHKIRYYDGKIMGINLTYDGNDKMRFNWGGSGHQMLSEDGSHSASTWLLDREQTGYFRMVLGRRVGNPPPGTALHLFSAGDYAIACVEGEGYIVFNTKDGTYEPFSSLAQFKAYLKEKDINLQGVRYKTVIGPNKNMEEGGPVNRPDVTAEIPSQGLLESTHRILDEVLFPSPTATDGAAAAAGGGESTTKIALSAPFARLPSETGEPLSRSLPSAGLPASATMPSANLDTWPKLPSEGIRNAEEILRTAELVETISAAEKIAGVSFSQLANDLVNPQATEESQDPRRIEEIQHERGRLLEVHQRLVDEINNEAKKTRQLISLAVTLLQIGLKLLNLYTSIPTY